MAPRRNSSPQTRALLLALAQNPREWRYGYDLSKETGLKSGTLYPLLLRLAEQGLLEDGWREPQERGKPPRHIYRLTPDGLALARKAAQPEQGANLQIKTREAGT